MFATLCSKSDLIKIFFCDVTLNDVTEDYKEAKTKKASLPIFFFVKNHLGFTKMIFKLYLGFLVRKDLSKVINNNRFHINCLDINPYSYFRNALDPEKPDEGTNKYGDKHKRNNNGTPLVILNISEAHDRASVELICCVT